MSASHLPEVRRRAQTLLKQRGRRANDWLVWIILIVVVLLGGLASPVFLTTVNLANLLSQSAVLVTAAIGVTYVMVVGEIDVSVAGTAVVAAVLSAAIMDGDNARAPLAIAITILFGAIVGLVNGLLVAAGVQSFILTLAVGTTLLAGGKLYTGGSPIGLVSPNYSDFFFRKPLEVPMPAWIMFGVLIVGWVVQSRSRLGHRIFLVGGNPSAAHLSGIRVGGTIVGAFVLSGVCAALAGLVILGRTGVPNDFGGGNLEFQALAAVALGGTAFSGGRGSVVGTLAGGLLISVSLQIGVILGWPQGAQLVEYGGLILVSVLVYSILRR